MWIWPFGGQWFRRGHLLRLANIVALSSGDHALRCMLNVLDGQLFGIIFEPGLAIDRQTDKKEYLGVARTTILAYALIEASRTIRKV